MDLSSLKPAEGSVKKNVKRVGRGQGSGKGGTSTRGHKGAQSRSGYSRRPGFEGGQMPLQRRVPKFGFKNPTRVEYVGFNLDRIQEFITKHNLSEITVETLYSHRMIQKGDKVKILGRGELTSKVDFKLHAFTAKAKEQIQKAGGNAETI
jgi:large subunit ribosomal protein L15